MLILASASKSRSALLKQVGIKHEIMPSNIDEEQFIESDVKKLVLSLSFAKAKCISSMLSRDKVINESKVVLGCDSLFEFKGNTYGKPKNHKEALERWKMLSSNSGELHTGHSLLFRESKSSKPYFTGVIQEVISTKIRFSKLSDMEIEQYVRTGEPLKSAGGFAIEGKSSFFIDSIEGCYSNVIGLSLPWLRRSLGSIEFFL